MKTISAPASLSGVPLTELKQWLAIATDSEDALLLDLLGAAHAMCERFTGIAPLKCEVCETFAAERLDYPLSARPVWEFLEARALGGQLDRRVLTPGEFTFQRAGADSGQVVLASPITEPQIELRYYAGFSDSWGAIEPGLRHGIIRYAAHQYRERDAGAGEGPPAAVAALWRPYRRMRL